MKATLGETIWMVDGSRPTVTDVRSKYILTSDGRKVLSTHLNRQHKTKLLLELQFGVKKFN